MLFIKDVKQAAEVVARERQNLAEAIGQGFPAMDLARSIVSLAEAEGVHEVFALVDQMKSRNIEDDSIRDRLVSLLVRGADDSWSGRANDARRAQFDGVRDAVQHHLDRLSV